MDSKKYHHKGIHLVRLYKIITVISGLLSFAYGGHGAKAQDEPLQAKTAYDFSFQKIDGGDLPLSNYKGKVLMVVNTASKCGFTKQYADLQKIYEEYKDRGVVVLGVPSNDFLGQEPGSNASIKKFCETNFGITFPMTEKVSVKGGDVHPFYAWAVAQDKGDRPGWNFHKFIIAPDGKLFASFSSGVEPDDDLVLDAIETLLP